MFVSVQLELHPHRGEYFFNPCGAQTLRDTYPSRLSYPKISIMKHLNFFGAISRGCYSTVTVCELITYINKYIFLKTGDDTCLKKCGKSVENPLKRRSTEDSSLKLSFKKSPLSKPGTYTHTWNKLGHI